MFPPPHQQPLTRLPSLPDLLLTALSVCFLVSSSKPQIGSSRCPFHRRSIKIPAMSLTTKNNLNAVPPRRHNFASPQSLSEWLKPRLPSESFASWGVKPGTKNVHNLWLELSQGETSLADSTPPVRTVHVVLVLITGQHGKFLVESHQELSDGNVRKRGRPLSEKMKPNEDPESAAVRGIMEELGSVISGGLNIPDIVTIHPNSYHMTVEERDSGSYPGLPGCYVLHTLRATVQGLPEGDFSTFEVDEYGGHFQDNNLAHQAVSVKKHYWTWLPAHSLPS
ncbi:hypothetical protein VNO78_01849 [Psophocarpus tetragonolobus]|uniref:Nudix hydrolase domain-containing protein n=1 Tax=Psophocarpus tetragonolobus TaxID=3891 RepID=A0AAN9SZW9_PSOTE